MYSLHHEETNLFKHRVFKLDEAASLHAERFNMIDDVNEILNASLN